MTWAPRKPKWDWQSFLTADERAALAEMAEAKAQWMRLNRGRAAITNRAIQRAKYAASSKGDGGAGLRGRQ